MTYAFTFDATFCSGCKACQVACKMENNVPIVDPAQADEARMMYWLDMITSYEGTYPAIRAKHMPKPCFHCDNPPCARVCPVGATFKRDDGIVLIDNERCIGCRFCMAACPYSVRTFNWSRPKDPAAANARGYSPEWGYPRRVGTAEKCDFCPDMARDGKLPHCAGVCPMGAIWFGDENEDAVTNSRGETVRLSKLLRDRAAYRELEELGTKPRVYYLPPDGRHFPAPGEPGANSGNQHTGVVQR